jgi:hypothetical protein
VTDPRDPWRSLDARALDDAPFFCEENVWRQLQSPSLPVPVDERFAVFISNRARKVAMWSQRAAAADPVVWDYHVVCLCHGAAGAVVVDVDCTAGVVLPLASWAAVSFRPWAPTEVAPRFRVVHAPDFLRTFSSDRSHMLDAQGQPLKPPPPWPAPSPSSSSSSSSSSLPAPMNLMRFVDLDDDDIGGFVCDLDELLRFGDPT